jgi:hypothetical protein
VTNCQKKKKGPSVWENQVGSVVSGLPNAVSSLTLSDAYIWFIGIMFALTHVPMW